MCHWSKTYIWSNEYNWSKNMKRFGINNFWCISDVVFSNLWQKCKCHTLVFLIRIPIKTPIKTCEGQRRYNLSQMDALSKPVIIPLFSPNIYEVHFFANVMYSCQCQAGIVQLLEALNQMQQIALSISVSLAAVQNNDKCIRMKRYLGDQVYHLFKIIALGVFLVYWPSAVLHSSFSQVQ